MHVFKDRQSVLEVTSSFANLELPRLSGAIQYDSPVDLTSQTIYQFLRPVAESGSSLYYGQRTSSFQAFQLYLATPE